MRVGLLFGSFDPIHQGHTAIARWAIQQERFDQVWIILSPQNPTKSMPSISFEHRAQMVRLAIRDIEGVVLSTLEAEMESPYYTINTVAELMRRYPSNSFSILCGTDVIKQCRKWHLSEQLHQMVDFVEYPRYENPTMEYLDVSSSEIRQGSKQEFLHPEVANYIACNKIYNSALERGKALYARGDFGGAINAWSECQGTSAQDEAETLSGMACRILAYSYTEIYNP